MLTVRRRQHHTRTADSVWHSDSTHKLMHWRLIASGCVDGHGRKTMWLKCSDNDRADTTCNCFSNAIEEHQCPYQVRGDEGSENRKIAKCVIATRGEGMRDCIGGKSTRSTRIERFWREHNVNVMKKFHDEFIQSEQLGCLDGTDDNDSWVLHQACLPVANEKMNEFKACFNVHPLRSAQGKMPNQTHEVNFMNMHMVGAMLWC